MTDFKPPLVFSIHGIRTYGEWQKKFSDFMTALNIPSASFSYGHFGLLKFANKASREKMIDAFCEYYTQKINYKKYDVDIACYTKRPSIVAHSFGTYIVAYCMLKYPEVKFDKIILCGSILPRDFPWFELINRDQINVVCNEYGVRDRWSKVVKWVIPGTGPSGTDGFTQNIRGLIEQKRRERFAHSDYFNSELHFNESWLPVLCGTPSPLCIRYSSDLDIKERRTAIQDLMKIDRAIFHHLPGYEEIAVSAEDVEGWLKVNPDIYTLLYDRKRMKTIGYINAVPVGDAPFSLILAGKKQDSEVNDVDIAAYVDASDHKLFLMSIAILPTEINDYFDDKCHRLLHGFLFKLILMAKTRKITISEMVAVAWTTHGKQITGHLGMKTVGYDLFTDEHGEPHPISWLDLRSQENMLDYRAKKLLGPLVDTYKKCCWK